MRCNVEQMIPILTGWLAGKLSCDAGETMKVRAHRFEPPDAFVVLFESGSMIRVKCEVVVDAAEKPA